MGKSEYSFFNNLFTYDIKDKKRNIKFYTENCLNKTVKMFRWEGLPETISPDVLEKQIQTLGYVAICKIPETELDPGFYSMPGEMSGAVNRYMLPSLFTVANPALKKSYNFKIVYPFGSSGVMEQTNDGDCVVIKNDSYYRGLLPIIFRYSTLLVETDITIYMTDILSRTQYAIGASDEPTKASALKFIDDLASGKLSVIGDNVFIDSLKTLPLGSSNGNQVTELIELAQYLRGSLLNELGLDANFNLKRERLVDSETELNKDGLTPLIENMLDSRKLACKQLKDLWGLNVNVELNGAWEHERVAMLAETANDIKEIQDMKSNSDDIEIDNGETDEAVTNEAVNNEAVNNDVVEYDSIDSEPDEKTSGNESGENEERSKSQ